MLAGFDTPILFLVFNRPTVTAQVFAAIQAARPTRLFVAADGPRTDREGEAESCAETRRIATAVDWPCTVTTLFRNENRGCGHGVSEAISWFFEQVEEGIILEDDCLPHPDFFRFAAAMLEQYRNDPKVLTVAGNHFLPAHFESRTTHYFSKYVQIWGWATWRRTWQAYDFTLNSLAENDWLDLIRKTCPLPIEGGYWVEIFRAMKAGIIDTWDFQLLFSCWRLGGLHVVPRHNLISNLGYGPDATHTNFSGALAQQPVCALAPPYDSAVSLEADPHVDHFIFYARFLEYLSLTWWVEQVLSPEQKLGAARIDLVLSDRHIRSLEREVHEKRRQLRMATDALSLAQQPATSSPCGDYIAIAQSHELSGGSKESAEEFVPHNQLGTDGCARIPEADCDQKISLRNLIAPEYQSEQPAQTSVTSMHGDTAQSDTPTPKLLALTRYFILLAFILGCAVLLIDRYKSVFTVTFDMGIQLNAAENLLVHGKPFSDHFIPQGPDLCIPGQAPVLTWFPPGFSVVFAMFRAIGLTSAAALKAYDILVLGLGLAGWGTILALILQAAAKRLTGFALLLVPWAFCLPIACSPWSGGTDSFLWATSAWTMVLLHLLVMRDRWVVAPLGCALLIAASISVRYAGVYLVLLMAAGLALHLRRGLWCAIRPGLVFSAGLIFFILPLYLYNAAAQHGSAAPPYTYQNPFTPGVFMGRLVEVGNGLAKANCLWGIPGIDLFLDGPNTPPDIRMVAGLGFLVVLIAAFGASLNKGRKATASELDIWTYLLFAAVAALILFLLVPSFGTTYNSIKDGRYYMPLIPALQLAAMSLLLSHRGWGKIVRVGCAVALVFFGLEALLFRTSGNYSFPLCYSGSRASCEWQPLLSWFRNGDYRLFTKPINHTLDLHYSAHEARAVLDNIRRNDPAALVFVQEPPYFHFDKANARILGIPDQYFWDKAFVSKTSNLYFFSTGNGKEIVSSLNKQPVVITDHLTIESFAETPYWTVRKIAAPAGAKLILAKP